MALVLLLIAFLTMMPAAAIPTSQQHVPRGLMVDLLTHPEEAVITNPLPRFSWFIDDSRQGAAQTSWQILVASSPEKLTESNADKWNSGIVHSDETVSIPYGGDRLEQNRSYWWKVRYWDHKHVAGDWSTPQMFRTGEFSPEGLKWPGESRWVTLEIDGDEKFLFENRHRIRYHDIPPVSIVVNNAGNHFITFEKAAFGTLKLNIDPAPQSGDTLVVHLGEKCTGNASVDRRPGGSIGYRRVLVPLKSGQTRYIIELPRQHSGYPNSQVLADHMPEVTPFRFAEIEGWNASLEKDQAKMHALLYHFDDNTSYFNSSCDILNQVWDICKHTLKATPFLGLYIDGTRERMPYEGDAYIQQISHYSVDREFAVQRYTNAFMIFNPSWPTEWQLHNVLMAWADYMATGDELYLKKYYEELKKKTLLALAREDGLISTRTGLADREFLESIHFHGARLNDLVDWPQGVPANQEARQGSFGSVRIEGETDRFVFSDINTVVNAFHYRNLVLMARIAGLLGKDDDRIFFTERSEMVRESINSLLLNKETGLYRDGEGVEHSSLHANMFPVAFGLAPKENYPQLKEFFKSKGMACSPYGAPHLMDALWEVGAVDYAIELLTAETDRSWMNMINIGATMTTEAWDMKFKNNMTWNHAWGASPVYTITRRIFGIEALEPAYRKVLVKPRPGPLKSAELRTPTIRGEIYARFEQAINGIDIRDNGSGTGPSAGKGTFFMELIIPANTTAKLMLPAPETNRPVLQINGKEISFQREGKFIVVDNLQAGKYEIDITAE